MSRSGVLSSVVPVGRCPRPGCSQLPGQPSRATRPLLRPAWSALSSGSCRAPLRDVEGSTVSSPAARRHGPGSPVCSDAMPQGEMSGGLSAIFGTPVRCDAALCRVGTRGVHGVLGAPWSSVPPAKVCRTDPGTSDRRPVTDVVRGRRARSRGDDAPAKYRADHATRLSLLTGGSSRAGCVQNRGWNFDVMHRGAAHEMVVFTGSRDGDGIRTARPLGKHPGARHVAYELGSPRGREPMTPRTHGPLSP